MPPTVVAPVPELLLHAPHEVVGQRLDDLLRFRAATGRTVARRLLAGHGVEDADGVAA